MVDIEEELELLDSNRACMSNSISAKLLEENRCICSVPLKGIIHSNIRTSNFHEGLKHADLTPKDDITDKEKYRPISLLPLKGLCKIKLFYIWINL